LTGYLRVTCSETLALRFITPEIARFRAARPGIIVDLLVDNRMLDLSRRETDVALRAERPTQGDFLGRKLSNIEWALFADPAYVDKRTAPKNLRALQHHSFIGWADPAPPMKAVAWVKRHVPPESIKFRTNTLVNQMNAAREGLGIALLPTYLVTDATRLIRVSAPLRTIMTELWIITHRSLKDTARIRNFMDFVGAGIKSRMSAVLTTEAD
jgi:DNA-binding transcriptional LysR family regulator